MNLIDKDGNLNQKALDKFKDEFRDYHLLREYYDEHIKGVYDVEFSELPEWYKAKMSKSISFNKYKLKHEFKKMYKEAIKYIIK